MKKIFTFIQFVPLAALLLAWALPANATGSIEASPATSWNLDAKPLGMVHTLDNRRVYILGDDSKVHVYSAEGVKQGAIPVDKGVTAIDIAPRGEMLYLINAENKTFSSLNISFTTPIDVTGAPFLGEENAPVVLAVFSDFQ